MGQRTLHSTKHDEILIVEINNPPANAYTHEMLRELDEQILDARFDDSIQVIVLTGGIEHFFSAGGDLKVLDTKSVSYKYHFALHGQEVLCRIRNTPKPVVAAVNGHAIGGGFELALAADLRIAKRDGGRVGLTEVNLGVMPGMGGTQMLPRLIGRHKALELCSLGKQISFEEALGLGLVHDIFERSYFFERVLEYARGLVPVAQRVGWLKRGIYSGAEMDLTLAASADAELAGILLQTLASKGATSASRKD